MNAISSSNICVFLTDKFSVLAESHDVSNLLAKSKHKLGVFLDVDEHYTRHLIINAFLKRKQYYHVTLGPGQGMEPVPLPSHCQFQWSEYERIDWDAVRAGKHGASSYCIRKGLSRKAQLAHFTHRFVCKNPHSILKRAIPETVVLDLWSVWESNADRHPGLSSQKCGGVADVVVSIGSGTREKEMNQRKLLSQCLQEARTAMMQAENDFENGTGSEPIWILKGSTTNKGAGIFIVHVYEQLLDLCWNESDIREWVLQRYIANPLLLSHRKFHIRSYVLAVSDLSVYLYKDCLALCSGSRYNKDDTTNMCAHITNTAFQSSDPEFREQDCVLLWNEETIGPILIRESIFGDLTSAKQHVRCVFEQMCTIIEDLFRAYENEMGVFSPIEGCFEHYGLDFIVDEQWKVYLLEVNPGPDFKQTGGNLKSVIEKLMSSTIDVAMMPLVHSNPVNKAGNFELAYSKETKRPSSGEKVQRKENDTFHCFDTIH
jgi:hypothetical protein